MACLKINQPAIQSLRMKSVKKHGFESLEVGSQLWRHENKAAIEAYKQLVEEHGTLGDDLRIF